MVRIGFSSSLPGTAVMHGNATKMPMRHPDTVRQARILALTRQCNLSEQFVHGSAGFSANVDPNRS
jgi:hypothetical protein